MQPTFRQDDSLETILLEYWKDEKPIGWLISRLMLAVNRTEEDFYFIADILDYKEDWAKLQYEVYKKMISLYKTR